MRHVRLRGLRVKLENSFEVPAPPKHAWALLMDVPRIIPCMPGAKLDEAVDDANWKATMAVKLGPISLSFKTDVKREEADEAVWRAKLSAKAREARGRGNASATIESSLTPQDGGTRVDIVPRSWSRNSPTASRRSSRRARRRRRRPSRRSRSR